MKKNIRYFIERIFVFFERKNRVNYSWLSDLVDTEPDIELLEEINFNKVSRVYENDFILKNNKIAPSGIPLNRQVSTQANLTGCSSFYKVTNAEIKGKFPVIYKNGRLILDSVFFSSEHDRIGSQLLSNHLSIYKETLKLNLSSNPKVIDNPSMLMFSKWNHYGHWVPEHLLKVILLKRALGDKAYEVNLILESEAPLWKFELLKILGWDESKIISWNENKATLKELYCSSYPEPNYELLCELKDELVKHYSFSPVTRKKRIYLSRNRYGTRGVENERELINFLADFGFETLYPEIMTLEEQLAAFVNAEVILGPHGSAFTNIIFSDKAKVVELFGKYVPLAFYCYSLVMGHDYKALHCSSGDNKNDNMIVNIRELETILVDIGIFKKSK